MASIDQNGFTQDTNFFTVHSMPYGEMDLNELLQDESLAYRNYGCAPAMPCEAEALTQSTHPPLFRPEGMAAGDPALESRSNKEMETPSEDSCYITPDEPLAQPAKENSVYSLQDQPRISQSQCSPKSPSGLHRCMEPNCNVTRPLADRASLLRHRREVHGEATLPGRTLVMYYCTHQTCKRHQQGFSRLWNLREHERRVHEAARGQARVAKTRQAYVVDPLVGSTTEGSTARMFGVEFGGTENRSWDVDMRVEGREAMGNLESIRLALGRLEAAVSEMVESLMELRAVFTRAEGAGPDNR